MKRGALKEEEKGQLRERAFVGAVISMDVSMVTKAGPNASRAAITHSQLEVSRERVQRRTKTLQPCLGSWGLACASYKRMWLYPQNSSSSEEKSQAPPQVAREVLRRSRLWKHLAKSCQWQEDQRPLLIQYLFNKYTESSFKLRAQFSKPERRLNRSPESKWSRRVRYQTLGCQQPKDERAVGGVTAQDRAVFSMAHCEASKTGL